MTDFAEDDELQRYLDQELSAAEHAAFQKRLDEDPALASRAEAALRFGKLIRLAAEESTIHLDSERLFFAIEEQGSLARHEEPQSRVAFAAYMQRRDRRIALLSTVCAVAAALALAYLQPWNAEERSAILEIPAKVEMGDGIGAIPADLSAAERAEAPGRSSKEKPSRVMERMAAVIDEPSAGSEVLEVDFGDHSGTVFSVEGTRGESLAVVWIAEDFANGRLEY
ncbi:MAG: hypothetical protein AAF355_10270 [Myxococcota bacterium]